MEQCPIVQLQAGGHMRILLMKAAENATARYLSP